MTNEMLDETDTFEEAVPVEDAASFDEEPPLYGVGPFTVREVAIAGVWLVAFIVSFFSVTLLGFESLWTSGIDWILTIGVPTVAVFLLILRRLSPQGIRRVGSLGIDQFASVAFSVSAMVWVGMTWNAFVLLSDRGLWVHSWVMWVELVLMLAGVVLTVFAPFIPPFEQDFRGRVDVPAHRIARPVRAVSPRPAPEPAPVDEPVSVPSDSVLDDTAAPVYASFAPPVYDTATDLGPAAPIAAPETAPAMDAAADDAAETPEWEPEHARDTFEHVEPTPAAAASSHEAFWALVPEERDVLDEVGIPSFRVGPSAWALVIEDRGDAFVVRHEDGRLGYLHDVSGVTRG